MSTYTQANVRQKGAKTPMIIPFSTTAGKFGAADAERGGRSFALEFYTEDANWDLLGNNTQ